MKRRDGGKIHINRDRWSITNVVGWKENKNEKMRWLLGWMEASGEKEAKDK